MEIFLKKSLKILLFSVFLLTGLLTTLNNLKTAEAAGFVPFGGKITLITVCNEGILLTVGAPRPGSYMLTLASRKFTASLIAPHPAQWILGIASPTPISCTVLAVPSGGGLPIILAGGSK